jgi:hypothetical protein
MGAEPRASPRSWAIGSWWPLLRNQGQEQMTRLLSKCSRSYNVLLVGATPLIEQNDSSFHSETYLTKIARVMAMIVEIRQGLSEDSSLRLKANRVLERLGQLANGEIKIEGNKVTFGEIRPWSPNDNPRHAAIRELYDDHLRGSAYGEMRSEFPADMWATFQACTFAEFLTEHPEALTSRTQGVEREMAGGQRGLLGDVSKQGNDPLT